MKERLTNNLGLKVLAIFLAFFVWLIVSNVSNPLRSESVEVTVDIINGDVLKDNNLTYEVVGKSTVTIYYDVHTLDAYKISASDFRATADLSELYDVTGSIPIKVEVVNNKSLIETTLAPYARPGVIQVKTEEIQRKGFDLQIHEIQGTEEEGYAVGAINLIPERIYATGAVSAVGQINSIGVVISKEGANADFTGTAEPKLYDANGNELTNLQEEITLNMSEITYQVTVLKVKTLGLDFQVEGTVAEGYRFTGVESDVRSVSVEGMKSTLASLSTLTIPSEYLDVSGATKDVVATVDLAKLLPEHVTIAGDEEVIATITLKVEPLETRGFKISTSDIQLIGASENREYTFSTGTLQIDIEGLSEDLDTLNIEDLTPTVDVSGLSAGDHEGILELEPKEGFQMTGHERFTITVEAEPGEDDQSQSSVDHETTGSEE